MRQSKRAFRLRAPSWWKMGCAIFTVYAAAAIAAPAQTFISLYSFCSQTNCDDGEVPWAGLVQGTDGNLYGTTVFGGHSGHGTAFKITLEGSLRTLYRFCSQTGCPDGYDPYAGLLQGTDGNFYGTTASGGSSCQPGGCGTAFTLSSAGALTTLVSFDDSDGALPQAALIQATNGNFYGTSYEGGAYGSGEVFELTPNGTVTTLHSFCERVPCGGGALPSAGLIQAADGNFYGVTAEGGTGSGCEDKDGCGTVFKITPAGNFTVLYSFCSATGCPDGEDPQGPLVQATDGNFYGTTTYDGDSANGGGTVFRITPQGVLTTLHSFCSQSNCADGAEPYAGVIQATDGNLYGTTYKGGLYNDESNYGGTIFKITLSGTLTTLYNFCSQANCADGSLPTGVITEDTNGTLYGTTYGGGESSTRCAALGCGTVFSLSVGLHEFVEAEPGSAAVGAAVNILGTNLESATSVTFSGTAASFTIVSRSLITTTVPAGATSGEVKVTTPYGTLRSNVPFRVLP